MADLSISSHPPSRSTARLTLIIMNNKSNFNEMTLDAIQAYHHAWVEQPVGERPLRNRWFHVLVNKEVMQTLAGPDPAALILSQKKLQDNENYQVKVIKSDPDNSTYTGLMRCSVYALWNLWVDMDGFTPMDSLDELDEGPYCG
jgi:hypothetical protein